MLFYLTAGKTEEFQQKIEEKQAELIPWSEKINRKQSEIDISKTEFNLLEEKINHAGKEIEKAKNKLEELLPIEISKVDERPFYF